MVILHADCIHDTTGSEVYKSEKMKPIKFFQIRRDFIGYSIVIKRGSYAVGIAYKDKEKRDANYDKIMNAIESGDRIVRVDDADI